MTLKVKDEYASIGLPGDLWTIKEEDGTHVATIGRDKRHRFYVCDIWAKYIEREQELFALCKETLK